MFMMAMWRVLKRYNKPYPREEETSTYVCIHKASLLFHILRAAWAIIVLASVNYAHSVAMYPDGSFKLGPDDIRGVGNGHYLVGISERAGSFAITVAGTFEGNNYFCTLFSENSPTGEKVDSAELAANNFAKLRQQLMAHIVGVRIRSDRADCSKLSQPGAQITHSNIRQNSTTTEYILGQTYRIASYLQWDGVESPELPELKPSCTQTVDPVDYGTIKPGITNIDAMSMVSITCDLETTVTVRTNGGEPYTDDRSGVLITFRDPPRQPCKQCRLGVTVTLVRGPTTPGKHRWQVPVIVEIM